eukprot:5413677-Pyramimonas_sp.AAC.1
MPRPTTVGVDVVHMARLRWRAEASTQMGHVERHGVGRKPIEQNGSSSCHCCLGEGSFPGPIKRSPRDGLPASLQASE